MSCLNLFGVEGRLLLIFEDDLFRVLGVQSVVLQVGAVQDFEELLVNLDVKRSVPLVPADEGLRGDLLVHNSLGLLLWLGVLVVGDFLELHVELRRKWVALHVRVRQLL